MKQAHLHSGKRTKVVATLGPATNSKATLKEMLQAGLNVVRLNFSHGDHSSHAQLVTLVRELSREMSCPAAIIGDLRGPRLRVGEMEGGCVTLTEGQIFTLTPETCLGNIERATISYPKLAQDLKAGDTLLLDNGSIQLQVKKLLSNGDGEGVITQAGALSSHRGVNGSRGPLELAPPDPKRPGRY